MGRWGKLRERRKTPRLAARKVREGRRKASSLRAAEALSHSFYRAKRRRRRQRERRLSIFTSNEFELKTAAPLTAPPGPVPAATATLVLRPRRHPLFHEPRQSLRGIITPPSNACDSGEVVFLSLRALQ